MALILAFIDFTPSDCLSLCTHGVMLGSVRALRRLKRGCRSLQVVRLVQNLWSFENYTGQRKDGPREGSRLLLSSIQLFKIHK